MCKKITMESLESPEKSLLASGLDEIIRDGARRILVAALESEVDVFVRHYESLRDENGRKLIVRNGYMPEREIVTPCGPLKIRQPRVDDRALKSQGVEERFTSAILPKYMRRTPNLDNLIPVLYLKGISTGDFPTALSAILGDSVKGLSASTVTRLKQIWEEDYKKWVKRDLTGKKYVYFWVDGIYFNVRLDDSRSCILVIMGADEAGNKELVAVEDGYRESKTGWKEILLNLRKLGLIIDPKLVIGDGALGFWAAALEVYGEHTKEQRCWVHKTANILDKMPKGVQSKAKSMIHEMYMAETKKEALEAFDHFVASYNSKYPKAVECLVKDKDSLFNFYDFPAEHWQHIRSTNPIESTFATVRHRTKRTKGCGSRVATLTMVFKLCKEAEKKWRKLRGYKKIGLVLEGIKFIDGIEEDELAA
jgi:transposase-like protein